MKYRVIALMMAAVMLLGACGKNAETGKESGAGENTETAAEQKAGDATASEGIEATNSDDSQAIPFSMAANADIPLNIKDDKYRTTYEIFVYSFYDSDGDGIGDLKGVIDKLDYINDGDDATDTDLGCNAIWLMPICPSPTYHKYDVTDYKAIDPEYGTMEDFEALVKACHDRNVNVYTDLVLNHTSVEHPWFKAAKEYLKNHADQQTISGAALEECPYLDYYNFTKEQQTGYERLNGTDWFYEARFWSGMPDLNLDSEAVRKEIADITQFWTNKGVDGFRLDAVTSYYTDNNDKNIEFMTWLNDTVKAQNENAYMVGEAWTALATYSTYYQSGIDSFFAFDFSGSEGPIASVARSKKAPIAYAKAMADAEKELAANNEFYVDAPFYTNHDMARSAGYFTGKGTDKKVKLAGALNLLMGGNAFIYYGEELGMKGSGKDENKRAPMQWSSDKAAAGMCKGPVDMEKFDMLYPSLEEQAQDPYSIYNYFKQAVRLRNAYPVIARGQTQPVEVLSDDDIGAFVKYKNSMFSSDTNDYIVFDENANNIGMDGSVGPALGVYEDSELGKSSLLILVNNSDEAKEVDLSKWSGTGENPQIAFRLLVDENDLALEGTKLTIPSYGIAVISGQ